MITPERRLSDFERIVFRDEVRPDIAKSKAAGRRGLA